MAEDNLLASIPDGDLRNWLVGWHDEAADLFRIAHISACNAEEARRGFEREHPGCEVINIREDL